MSRRKTIQRIIPYFILICALFSGILIARPLLDFIKDQLRSLQDSLVELVEQATDLKVRYSHLSPSLLLQADINDLRLERPDGSVFFAADRVRVSYSLLELLGGTLGGQKIEAIVKAVTRIEMVGGHLSIDTVKDAERFGQPGGVTTAVSGMDVPARIQDFMDWLGRNIPIGLTFAFLDTRVDVASPGLALAFASPSARFNAQSDRLELQLELGASTDASLIPGLGGHFEGTLGIEGQYFRATRQLQTRVALGDIASPWGTLTPQQLELNIASDEIRLRRITDQQPIDLRLNWNLARQMVEADFQAENWRLGGMFVPSSNLGEWETVLFSGRYSAKVHVAWELASSTISYQGSLSGHGQWKSPDDTSFAADLRGDNHHLPEGALEFALPGARVEFTNGRSASVNRLAGDLKLDLDAPWVPTPVRVETAVSAIVGASNLHVEIARAAVKLGDFPLVASEAVFDYRNGKLGFLANCLPLETSGPVPEIRISGSYAAMGSQGEILVHDFRVAKGAGLIRPLGLLLAGTDPGESDLSFLPPDLSLGGLLKFSTDGGLRLSIDYLAVRTAAFDPQGGPTTVFSGAVHYADNTLALENSQLELPGFHLEARGRLSHDGQGGMTASLDVTDGVVTPWRFTGSRTTSGRFDIQGPYGFYATGSSGPGGVAVQASFVNFPIKPLGSQAMASGSLAATVGFDGSWTARVQKLDLVSLDLNPLAPRKPGRVTLFDAAVTETGVTVGEIRYQDAASTLSGRGRIDWKLSDLPRSSWTVALRGNPLVSGLLVNPNPEILTITGGWDASGVHSHVQWVDAPFSRFIDETLRGFFNVDFDLAFNPEAPLESLSAQGNLTARRAFINKDLLALTAACTVGQGKVSLRDFEAEFLEHRLGIDRLDLDLALGSLGLSARYDRPKDAAFVPVLVTGRAGWTPEDDLVDSLFGGSLTGSLDLRNMAGMDKALHDYHIRLDSSGGSLVFSETNAQLLRGRVRRDGSFQGMVQRPFPVTATVDGRLDGGQITANISNMSLDLSVFAKFLDLGVFKLKEGMLNGSLRVVGDINDPDFFGSLRGTGIKASLSVIPDELTAARGALVFEEKKVRFLPLVVKAGTDTARVEGDFTLSRLNIVDVSIRADVPLDGPGVHVMGDFPMITVDGRAKGGIAVVWTGNTLKVQGQITAENASLQMLTQPSGDGGGAAVADAEPFYYEVALGLTSGKGVEFFFPSKTIPWIKTYVDIGQTMTVSLNSARDAWSIKGDLRARGGEIVWAKTNFVIRDATLVFNLNQDSYEPRINARAIGRIPYADRIINLTLQFEDNGLYHLQPRIITDIPVSTDRLLALLTGDALNENASTQYGAENFSNLLASAGGVATQFLLADPINRFRAVLGLDLLSIRSDVIANVAVDAFRAAAGGNPLDNGSLSPGEWLTVQAGNFFGNDVYLERTFRLKQTPSSGQVDWSSASGFMDTFGKAAGIGVELELNMDWNTPFFDINWNWAPKNLTSVDQWLKANTFTLSWSLQ